MKLRESYVLLVSSNASQKKFGLEKHKSQHRVIILVQTRLTVLALLVKMFVVVLIMNAELEGKKGKLHTPLNIKIEFSILSISSVSNI